MRSGSDVDRVATGRVALGGQPDDTAGGARLPGEVGAFAAVSAVMIVVGGLVAAINSATPFGHGSWLAAYLVLVGGVSQLMLGAGCVVLPAPRRSAWLRRVQLGLWNAGIVVVAVGVFAGLAAIVLTGSAVVLGALGCFAAVLTVQGWAGAS